MSNIIRIKRRVSGAPGAPTGLKSAELAYNMADNTIYAGYGDDGSGNATAVKPIGGEGTIALAGADVSFDGFSLSYTEAPLRKVQLEMRAMWTQQMFGTIDVTLLNGGYPVSGTGTPRSSLSFTANVASNQPANIIGSSVRTITINLSTAAIT